VYIDVYRSGVNTNINQNDSVFVQTFTYNPLSDTNVLENNLMLSLSGLAGNNGDSYQLIAQARDQYGNTNDNFEVVQSSVSNANSMVHHFDVNSGYALNSLPLGKDIIFTLIAKNVSDQTIEAFTGEVYIEVQENEGLIFGSWNSDKFAGKDKIVVNMKGGVGYFVMNNSEKEDINIGVKFGTNISQDFVLGFAASHKGISTTSQFALYADNTEFNSREFVKVTVFALNADGMINTDYTGNHNVTFRTNENMNDYSVKINDQTVEGNNRTFSLNFVNGEAVAVVKNILGAYESYEEFSLSAIGDGAAQSNLLNLKASNNPVNEVLINGAEHMGEALNKTSYGSRIKINFMTGYGDFQPITYYNGIVYASVVEDPNNNNSVRIADREIKISNGIGNLIIDNVDKEMVRIKLERQIDGIIALNKEFYVTFASVDVIPPKLVNAYAENPYLIHLVFSEPLDPVNVFKTSNYRGIGPRIHTVCYYSDEVTLHLATPLTLNKNITIQINNDGADGIKDKAGNYLTDNSKSFATPGVDLIGNRASDEYFAVELPANFVAKQSVNTTFRVVVKHMNACGFLSGKNTINAKHKISNAKVSYEGVSGVTGPSTIEFTDGKAEFNVTVPANPSTGDIIIRIDDSVIRGGGKTNINNVLP
nr:Ig-like domain-containing protein [Candidatus Dependentiae bacterium]